MQISRVFSLLPSSLQHSALWELTILPSRNSELYPLREFPGLCWVSLHCVATWNLSQAINCGDYGTHLVYLLLRNHCPSLPDIQCVEKPPFLFIYIVLLRRIIYTLLLHLVLSETFWSLLLNFYCQYMYIWLTYSCCKLPKGITWISWTLYSVYSSESLVSVYCISKDFLIMINKCLVLIVSYCCHDDFGL